MVSQLRGTVPRYAEFVDPGLRELTRAGCRRGKLGASVTGLSIAFPSSPRHLLTIQISRLRFPPRSDAHPLTRLSLRLRRRLYSTLPSLQIALATCSYSLYSSSGLPAAHTTLAYDIALPAALPPRIRDNCNPLKSYTHQAPDQPCASAICISPATPTVRRHPFAPRNLSRLPPPQSAGRQRPLLALHAHCKLPPARASWL